MDTLEDAFSYDRALVLGIGGGGDVVGTIPTARLLEDHGVETIVGGVSWERWEVDPNPGPWPLDEVRNVERVSDAVGLASGDTTTPDGVAFAETGVAAHYGKDVALLDLSGGAEGVRAGVDAAADALDADLVVGTDSGGDVLAAGDEPGLASPLADAVCLAALADLETDAFLGVFGYGSDGELGVEALDAGVERAAERGGLLGAWGLTPRVVREMEAVFADVVTEASRLPVEAAQGRMGERAIRGGSHDLSMTPASTVTFYVEPGAVLATSDVGQRVRGTESLAAADRALRDAGYETELAHERGLAE
jgi:hypothetical protein